MKAAENEPAADSKYPRIGLFIDGNWIYDRPASSEVLNPSDDTVIGTIPRATPDDLQAALDSAQRGYEVWKTTPASRRAAILHRAAELLRERCKLVAYAITLEQGKPNADARNEVARASTFLDWDAEQGLRTYGRILPAEGDVRQYVIREPIGPVAAFTPWNVPLSSPARKISGALAAGCSIIIKPAQETPATVCLFAQCFADAGLPDGVLNVVFGKSAEISETLIASPIIRMVTLTGSVAVGKHLSRLAADAMKPVLMELGGHAPVIVGADVDPKVVAEMATVAKFRMAGQLCVSPTRFLVHKDVYEPFVSEFGRRASELRVGDGFSADVQMGPVVNQRAVTQLTGLVDDAVKRGAKILSGGQRVGNRGSYFGPTVLSDVPLQAEAMTEEPFGPLALCLSVDNVTQAMTIANGLPIGLAAYAFSNSASEIDMFISGLQAGSVAINNFGSPGAEAPFGGLKESGIGKEGGVESLDSYMTSRTILQRVARI